MWRVPVHVQNQTCILLSQHHHREHRQVTLDLLRHGAGQHGSVALQQTLAGALGALASVAPGVATSALDSLRLTDAAGADGTRSGGWAAAA